MKDRVVGLEAELDELERSVTGLADSERAAVRRVEAARRQVRGARRARRSSGASPNDLAQLIASDDPNDVAIAQTLLGSVLEADDEAVQRVPRRQGAR